MARVKRWRVVLDAENPPACGDWLAANGMVPGEEETVRFTFLDGSQADGFTFKNEKFENGLVLSANRLCREYDEGEVPWLYFPDCMEVVGVQRLDWQPESWPHDKVLWLLTVESLPSNIEFEKRFDQGQAVPRQHIWRLFRQ